MVTEDLIPAQNTDWLAAPPSSGLPPEFRLLCVGPTEPDWIGLRYIVPCKKRILTTPKPIVMPCLPQACGAFPVSNWETLRRGGKIDYGW